MNEESVDTALRQVHDSELPVNIVDLGVIYEARDQLGMY
jgi:metal-sulfur cluster biosynthetic enzyme